MTILYEVETGHSSKVLKAFARIYNEKTKKNKKIMFRYFIVAAILCTIPRAFAVKGNERLLYWGAGLIVIAVALLRNQISYLGLLYRDPYYKYGIKIRMSFGHSGFEVQDKVRTVSYKYNLIQSLYADRDIFYLHMEDDDLFLVPREDFVLGDPKKFYEFMQNAARKEFEAVNLTFKQRLYKKRIEMAQAREDSDAKGSGQKK